MTLTESSFLITTAKLPQNSDLDLNLSHNVCLCILMIWIVIPHSD